MKVNTVKLGYNEPLGTGHFARYNWVLSTAKFVLTKFHYITNICFDFTLTLSLSLRSTV